MSWFNKKDISMDTSAKEKYFDLQDPRLPSDNLKQVGYICFDASAITFIIYSEGTIDECMLELMKVAPIFAKTQAYGAGGSIPGFEDANWVGYESQFGSMIAYYCWPGLDSEKFGEEVLRRFGIIPTKLKWVMRAVGAQVPETVANIFNSGHAVPIWEIRGLEHTRIENQPESVTEFPEALCLQFVENGGERIDNNLYKFIVKTNEERSQILWVAINDDNDYALISPVTKSVDGKIPNHLSELAELTFGNYCLKVLGEFVSLVDTIPAQNTTPEMALIAKRGVELAIYADTIEAQLKAEDAL